jgi:hypothetical protein
MTQQGSTIPEVENALSGGHSVVCPIGGPNPSPSVPASAPETDQLPEVAPGASPTASIAPEGHVHLVLPPGEVITAAMATAAAGEVDRLAGTGTVPLLLVLTGVEAITRGARAVFGSHGTLAAVAVLGVSPVDRVIANFLLGGNVQPCPTRYFSTHQEALDWLERKKKVA